MPWHPRTHLFPVSLSFQVRQAAEERVALIMRDVEAKAWPGAAPTPTAPLTPICVLCQVQMDIAREPAPSPAVHVWTKANLGNANGPRKESSQRGAGESGGNSDAAPAMVIPTGLNRLMRCFHGVDTERVGMVKKQNLLERRIP